MRLLGSRAPASVAVAHVLSYSKACGIFPDQGSNPSPALAGGFFTTEPPGKPLLVLLKPSGMLQKRVKHKTLKITAVEFKVQVRYLKTTI